MNSVNALLVFCMLVFGSWNTLDLKFQFETCVSTIGQSLGLNGCPAGQRFYNKPWTQNWTMFWGEALLLPLYILSRRRSARRRVEMGKLPRPGDDSSPLLFAFPACCDTMASGLAGVSMMFIDASVWQMMRGVVIIFTAILTVLVLKKRLRPFHYLALFITTCGLTLVGSAAVFSASHSTGGPSTGGAYGQLIGICIMLVAQLFSATQFTVEEYLLQGRNIASMKVVGMEGLWGVLIQGAVLVAYNLAPGHDNGVLEDMDDSVVMYTGPDNGPILFLTASYLLAIAVYNGCGLQVTKKISAVTRCLIDCCRTITVWGVSLSLYYSGYHSYGSPWGPCSWLQLVGFLLLVLGTLIYNKVIFIPGLNYDEDLLNGPSMAFWSPKITSVKGLDNYEISPPCSPLQTPLLTSLAEEDFETAELCLAGLTTSPNSKSKAAAGYQQ